MEISTGRCLIRNLNIEDADDLFEVLSDENVMMHIEPVFDIEQTKNFIIDAGLQENPLVYAVIWKRTGKVIGHVIFHPYEESDYEIGWILHRDYWGLGIADELTKVLLQQAKALGVKSCVIECDTESNSSKKIAINNGFLYEGRSENLEVYRLML